MFWTHSLEIKRGQAANPATNKEWFDLLECILNGERDYEFDEPPSMDSDDSNDGDPDMLRLSHVSELKQVLAGDVGYMDDEPDDKDRPNFVPILEEYIYGTAELGFFPESRVRVNDPRRNYTGTESGESVECPTTSKSSVVNKQTHPSSTTTTTLDDIHPRLPPHRHRLIATATSSSHRAPPASIHLRRPQPPHHGRRGNATSSTKRAPAMSTERCGHATSPKRRCARTMQHVNGPLRTCDDVPNVVTNHGTTPQNDHHTRDRAPPQASAGDVDTTQRGGGRHVTECDVASTRQSMTMSLFVVAVYGRHNAPACHSWQPENEEEQCGHATSPNPRNARITSRMSSPSASSPHHTTERPIVATSL
ncbi:hypothetical protein K443DRAFT_14518 [Laccaria amethystina LaAM-08-1]|uniref:Uncharacterized protein n=1 Tax=Laccaria amethystina LaAM-08-1 TaxID=1095629 RepID=A0A0C9WHJ3_9AGAR|nr:hypothetical protein K443DRAFT_14518 [Laccaria amethystina LaAM-08-1]